MSAQRSRTHSIAAALVLIGALAAHWSVRAQAPAPDPPPFSLPFTEPAGPATWLFQQPYGNTVAAFNYGDVWYEFGQGLHFGLDFEAPCGTPVHAIADGVVVALNSPFYGAGPRNIVLDHPGTGYASLYGHLSRNASGVYIGDTVARGDIIGYSGDPDGSCGSRPHLHLEIRSADHLSTTNPAPLLAANWHMLGSVGLEQPVFQQDLDTPRRWMRLEDQPDVHFGGNTLNLYAHPWPPPVELAPPPNPPPDRILPVLPQGVDVEVQPISRWRWGVGAWWQPEDNTALYVVDAPPKQTSAVYRLPLTGGIRQFVRPTPPLLTSPDGSITIERQPDGLMQLTRPAENLHWTVDTQGIYPAISPDGARLLWRVVYGDIVPGTSTPAVAFWVSNVDGSAPRRVYSARDATAQWVDARRILITRRITYTPTRELYLLDITQPEAEPQRLGAYDFLHTLRVGPGGAFIAFFLAFQKDPAANGIYTQRTIPGSSPQRVAAFGAYRWRDRRSLYLLSFDPAQNAHALGVADASSGRVRWLTDPATLPIRVASGAWSVSPDGQQIAFLDPQDYGLYLLRLIP